MKDESLTRLCEKCQGKLSLVGVQVAVLVELVTSVTTVVVTVTDPDLLDTVSIVTFPLTSVALEGLK